MKARVYLSCELQEFTIDELVIVYENLIRCDEKLKGKVVNNEKMKVEKKKEKKEIRKLQEDRGRLHTYLNIPPMTSLLLRVPTTMKTESSLHL